MRIIALRFADNIAPEGGTIVAHEKYINMYGHVWYGKFGGSVSNKVIQDIMKEECPKILLIHSGTNYRYWGYISDITKQPPDLKYVPEYYHSEATRINTWFCIIKFERAEKNVMSKCVVASSGTLLSHASRHSMSPYFIVDYTE